MANPIIYLIVILAIILVILIAAVATAIRGRSRLPASGSTAWAAR